MKSYDVFITCEDKEMYLGIFREIDEEKACILAKIDLQRAKDFHSYDLEKATFRAELIL